MRNYFLICILAASLLIAGNAGADESLSISLSFNQKDLSIIQFKGFDVVGLKETVFPEDEPGTPMLPARYINILIPSGAEVTGVTGQALDEVVAAENLLIYPVQEPVPLSKKTFTFTNPNLGAYANTELKPLVQYTNTQKMRGLTFVPVRVNPVRLKGSTGELFLAQKITITVSYLLPAQPLAVPAKNFEVFQRMVNNIVVNPIQINSGVQPADGNGPLVDYDYIIITNSTLSSSFQALANHRATKNGFSTLVLDRDTIYSTYSGSDNQAKIKACIKDYVDNHATLYVVLGGDNTVIPDRNCYVSCGSYTCTDMPTDLYYAGLDSNWNEDGDTTYGEADTTSGDEGDLAPDVILGRIPVRTTTQADDYINKLKSYENSPPIGIAQKFMVSGKMAWNSYTTTDRPSDAMNDTHLQFQDANHPTVTDSEMWIRRVLRDRVQAYGWNPATVGAMVDTLTSWDTTNAGDYAASGANMATRFSEGWNFAVNMTHGGTTVLAAEGNFGIGNASAITGWTSIFYTAACLSGGFDSGEPSMSEAMLRNPNGASIAYFGCSRYGWGSPDSPPANNTSTGGTSLTYMRKFCELIFNNRTLDLGEVFTNHKVAYAGSSGWNGSYRWVQFGMNFQGDPAISIIGVLKASGDTAGTNEDTPVFINVLSNDVDTDGDTLSVSAVVQPTNGTVVNNGTNVQYTPDADWNGADSFSYTASDGNGDTHSATVSVTVNPINDAPGAVDDADSTNEDSGVTIDVLGNDNDVDGDTLSVNSVTQPSDGTAAINGTDVDYTPDPDFNGTDSFTYTTSDGNGGTDTATVTVTVNALPDAPVANDDSPKVDKNTAKTINVLKNDTDADGDTLTISSVTQPVNGTVVNNGTDVDYTPDTDYLGSDTFTYDISDGNGGSDTATVTVTVQKPSKDDKDDDDEEKNSFLGCGGCSQDGISREQDQRNMNSFLMFAAFLLMLGLSRFGKNRKEELQ